MPQKPKPLPTAEELHGIFEYEAETGALYAKVSRTSRVARRRCDNPGPRGYRIVYVRRNVFAHRVIWKMVYGTDPTFLDHINGNPLDNRISNLRECSHIENMRNRKAATHSESGMRGIHKRKDNGKWRAYFIADGKRIWLGQYETIEEARAVLLTRRKEAHKRFHKNS